MGFFDKLFKGVLSKDNSSEKPKAQVTITAHATTADEFEAQRLERVNEIRELDKNAYPSKNGLSPSEIMMLSYAEYYATDTENFPRFWFYDYAIDDPRVTLTKLLNRGFIQVASAADSLSDLTVKSLKGELGKRDLPVTGKKSALIERLVNSISKDELELLVTSRKYRLTDLGKEELEQNKYVPYLHDNRSYGISIWDLNKQLHEHPGHQWRDLIWEHLNKCLLETMSQFQYGGYTSYANIKGQMANFLLEENRYRDAAAAAVECSYYRMNKQAVAYYQNDLKTAHLIAEPCMKRVRNPETGKNELVEDISSTSIEKHAVPVVYEIDRYKSIKCGLNFDDNAMFQMLMEYAKDFCKPTDAFTPDEIAGIIVAKLNDTEDDHVVIANVCKKAEQRIMAQK